MISMTGTTESVIFCFGANHRSADISLREKLFAGEDVILERLPQIKARFGFSELATLSTCNRFEIFGVGSRAHATHPDFVANLTSALLSFDVMGQESAEQVRQAAYSLTGRDAVRHLFSVAASLDSLVIGETQITGQFKRAFAMAEDAQTLGPVLARLGQDALAASKKVRNQTAIGRGRVSIGHAAVELVKKIFNDPATKNFVVIGAGEMAEVTARCVLQYNPKSLHIVNRSLDRARELTGRLQGAKEIQKLQVAPVIHAAALDHLAELIGNADVVICATGAPHHVVTKALVATSKQCKSSRRLHRAQPMLMVDIGMPRNIDPACGYLDDVYLFDIDDLKQVVEGNRQDRLRAVDDATQIIDESVTSYERWLAHMTVAPALQQFNNHLAQLFHREAEKIFGKKISRHEICDEQSDQIYKLLDILASRLTADAGRGLRSLVDEGKGQDAAALLSRIFKENS